MTGLGNRSNTKDRITNIINQGKLEEALRELANLEEGEKNLLIFKNHFIEAGQNFNCAGRRRLLKR